MSELSAALVRWQMDMAGVRERMYRAPTPRERERRPALWLLAQEWPASRVAEALERDPHTVGIWLADFIKGGPEAVAFAQTGGPPALEPEEQTTPEVCRCTGKPVRFETQCCEPLGQQEAPLMRQLPALS